MEEKKKKKSKKRRVPILLILVLLAGLSLLLYPTVSDYINSLDYRKTITEYRESVEEMDDDTYEKTLAAAIEYNIELSKRAHSLTLLPDDLRERYESLLNTAGTSLMGYIEIPAIKLSLPIYHGTGDAALQAGVGHMDGSSLPVGGETAHCILSAHTGLPSAKLFTDIDQLVEGDIFTLHVLREELTYQVDQITVVEPREVGSICMEEGMDYCTLITCTPYGVNTHRLLVRGHRIETPEEATEMSTGNIERPASREELEVTKVLIPLSILFGLGLLIVLIIRIKRERNQE